MSKRKLKNKQINVQFRYSNTIAIVFCLIVFVVIFYGYNKQNDLRDYGFKTQGVALGYEVNGSNMSSAVYGYIVNDSCFLSTSMSSVFGDYNIGECVLLKYDKLDLSSSIILVDEKCSSNKFDDLIFLYGYIRNSDDNIKCVLNDKTTFFLSHKYFIPLKNDEEQIVKFISNDYNDTTFVIVQGENYNKRVVKLNLDFKKRYYNVAF